MNEQRHKYEYEAKSNSAAVKVARLVGVGKRVLELGSGPGSITRLLQSNQCRVTALETDAAAIEIVSRYCEAVFPCDLNDPGWSARLVGSDKFEVIVAGDVLEHLYDPWATLGSLHPLLAEGGHVVVSLPHAGHNAVIACLLSGNFEYRSWGLLDKTHIRFFGIRNIQKLFNDAGFKIMEADFVVKTPEQTELASHWRQLSSKIRRVLATSEFGLIYQVVVKAVPHAAHGKGLQLASLRVPSSADGFIARIRRSRLLGYLFSLLGLRMQGRISRMLERMASRF